MESKWELKLHDRVEDPYYEITNGQISLIANCGFVGEDDADEENIFNRVKDELNISGIDFHSGNKLELEQHIDIMKQSQEIEELQAKVERYEKALKNIEVLGDGATIMHLRTCKKVANEALAGEGEVGDDNPALKFAEWVQENAVAQYKGDKLHSWQIFRPYSENIDYTTEQLWGIYQKETKQ
jgi:hypothetical protein